MSNCIDLIKEARPNAPKGSFYSCPHGRVYRLKRGGWKLLRNPWLIRRVERQRREALMERVFDELLRTCEAAAEREAEREARAEANREHNAKARKQARDKSRAEWQAKREDATDGKGNGYVSNTTPWWAEEGDIDPEALAANLEPTIGLEREDHKRRVLGVFHAARRAGRSYNEAVDYSVERYAENNHLNKHLVHNMLLEAYNEGAEAWPPRVSLIKDDGTDKTPEEIRADAAEINAAVAEFKAARGGEIKPIIGVEIEEDGNGGFRETGNIKVELSPAVAVDADGTRRPAPVISVNLSGVAPEDREAAARAAADAAIEEQIRRGL
ncbi:hypothetical protein HYP71_gp078 [Arthrobacter phage KBurrousTX]|uniref:Uncharacterized protein n=1 Tax=Arthrobacter phage KBurrousTX TaxID=2315608 RepID=A0A386K9W6_9CAUD|nr:hypothetical protein HYP71_gp078 [Arthrobacter phage KBurrousTX]AYD81572.1 hypothetical protein KBurrousTX_78 [Arthrobacter phage KBurrousTX]